MGTGRGDKARQCEAKCRLSGSADRVFRHAPDIRRARFRFPSIQERHNFFLWGDFGRTPGASNGSFIKRAKRTRSRSDKLSLGMGRKRFLFNDKRPAKVNSGKFRTEHQMLLRDMSAKVHYDRKRPRDRRRSSACANCYVAIEQRLSA